MRGTHANPSQRANQSDGYADKTKKRPCSPEAKDQGRAIRRAW
jgi:hypothetical protein